MARIKGYTGEPSQEVIDRNILDKERKMLSCLLKAAKWNKSGATIDDWLLKAEVQALEIQTLKSKCEDKTYSFVDESLESGCKVGKGLGFMRLQPTDNPDGCLIFKLKELESGGEFSYCEFVPAEFTKVVGVIPDMCGSTCRQLPYPTGFVLRTCQALSILLTDESGKTLTTSEGKALSVL